MSLWRGEPGLLESHPRLVLQLRQLLRCEFIPAIGFPLQFINAPIPGAEDIRGHGIEHAIDFARLEARECIAHRGIAFPLPYKVESQRIAAEEAG